MNVKSLFVTALSLLLTGSVWAQDKIFKKNGELIDAKVSVINSENIIFKRYDNPSGPEYSIPKADVAKIVYVNGTEDVFEDNNDRIGVPRSKAVDAAPNFSIKRNILSVAPIMLTENGYGAGIYYERFLDKAGWVSLSLPFIATFNIAESNPNGSVRTDPMFYFAPGIKIYTNVNSARKCKFSIGPSLVVAAGRSTNTDDYYYSYPDYTTQTRFMLGAIIDAGLNLFPTPNLYLGADFGLGISYFNQYDGIDHGISGLTQLSFKIGYRFNHVKKAPQTKTYQ